MSQYIRADKRKGRTYWWLVESYRQGDRVIQKRLKYLGTKKPDLAATKWGYAFGSKGVTPTKKEEKKITTEKKPTKPRVVQDDLSWLLG